MVSNFKKRALHLSIIATLFYIQLSRVSLLVKSISHLLLALLLALPTHSLALVPDLARALGQQRLAVV